VNEPRKQDPLSDRRAAAELRVRAALDALERAQSLIEIAAQSLSSVEGLYPEHQRLGRVRDQVHRTWQVVRQRVEIERKRGRLLLDHEPDAHELWSAR